VRTYQDDMWDLRSSLACVFFETEKKELFVTEDILPRDQTILKNIDQPNPARNMLKQIDERLADDNLLSHILLPFLNAY